MRLKNRYFLLRHGDTTWTRTDLIYPLFDSQKVKLTKVGRKQIFTVAKRLKKESIDKIYSSDFYRTKQTAEIVAKELNLRVNFDKRLRDINLGIYHGKTKEQFYRDFPNLAKRFRIGPPKGESWDTVKRRMGDFLREIEKKYWNKNILIVSHGDPLWLLEGVARRLTNQQLLDKIFLKGEYIKKGELRKLI